jgi:anti-sigma B factor antagonist
LFDLQESEQNGWQVVAVVGEVDLATAPRLRGAVLRAVAATEVTIEAPPLLIVDLSGVDLIDSSGLGVIIGAHRRTRVRGGVTRVVVADDHVRHMFALTEVDRIIDVFASRAAAIDAPVITAEPIAEPGGVVHG